MAEEQVEPENPVLIPAPAPINIDDFDNGLAQTQSILALAPPNNNLSAAQIVSLQLKSYGSWATNVKSFITGMQNIASISSITVEGLPAIDYSRGAQDVGSFPLLDQLIPARPTFVVPNADVPASPALATATITDIAIPDFTATSPSINIPVAPTFTAPNNPAQPTLDDIVIPQSPTLTLPTAPTLAALTFPDAPSIQIPIFSATVPIDDLVAPTNTFAFAEVEYQSALLDALKAKLLDNLLNGGYGIETADELALVQRERDRESEISLMAVEEIYRIGASRGFPLPPGDLNVATQRAQQALQDKMSTVSRDIAIKRDDLYVENRKFTIQESRQLETTLLNYHNAVMERALNAQKAILDASIAIFDSQVRRFNARLEGYRILATVYEIQIRSQLALIELYRAQLSAVQVQAEVQKNQVEIYRALLQAVEEQVQIYRVQMEAANIQSQVQRSKIDAFRALIESNVAIIQGQTAQMNMFEAQVRGELAKVQVFGEQARAYSAQVQGLEVRANVEVNKARIVTERNRDIIAKYNGDIQASSVRLDQTVKIVGANLDAYKSDIQRYVARIQAASEVYRLQQSDSARQNDYLLKANDQQIEEAKIAFAALSKLFDIKLKASEIAGHSLTTLLAAIAGGIQAVTSVSKST